MYNEPLLCHLKLYLTISLLVHNTRWSLRNCSGKSPLYLKRSVIALKPREIKTSDPQRNSPKGIAKIATGVEGVEPPSLRFWRPLLCQLSYTPSITESKRTTKTQRAQRVCDLSVFVVLSLTLNSQPTWSLYAECVCGKTG